MRIGLIAMSGVRVRTKELTELGVTLPQFVNRGAVIASLPSLGLLTVAALTPSDIEVVYREIDELPGDGELEMFDLVGISSFTAMIDDAYALADRYRAIGVSVVIHVLLMLVTVWFPMSFHSAAIVEIDPEERITFSFADPDDRIAQLGGDR